MTPPISQDVGYMTTPGGTSMSRRIPLIICGPLLAVTAFAAPTGNVDAACTVTSSLRQTGADQVSDSVRCLQQTLNDKGFNSGPVDGWFGPVTHAAVVAYQQANGLTVDGWVGRETRNSLGIVANFDGGNDRQQPAPRQQQSGGPTDRQPTEPPQENRQANTVSADSGGGTVWDRLAQCESGGNWSISTGNGYYGGLQFAQQSWNAAGGSGNPANASRAEQIRVAENLLDMQGWGAWPACSRRLGLR